MTILFLIIHLKFITYEYFVFLYVNGEPISRPAVFRLKHVSEYPEMLVPIPTIFDSVDLR